jgi:hypothetical protein
MPEVFTELVEPDRATVWRQGSRTGPLLPVMPAVANAIYDAVGVRIDEVPITPEGAAALTQGRGKPARPNAFPIPCPPLEVPPPWEGGDGTATEK